MSRTAIRLAHLNIRSIRSKNLEELGAVMNSHNLDVLVVSETWLDLGDEFQVHIPGYTFVHWDRLTRGGGVGIFIADYIHYAVVASGGEIEQLWIRLTMGRVDFYIGAIYRPPDLNFKVFFDELEKSFSQWLSESMNIFCCGDFNLNLLKYDSPSVAYFNDFLDAINGVQLIEEPTRVTESSSTLIDFIIATNNELILKSGVIDCALSDHDLIFCDIKCHFERSVPIMATYRDIKNLDVSNFLTDLYRLPLIASFICHPWY